MTKIQERNAKFEAVFSAGGISTRRIKCLGPFVHVDTFEKYAQQIDAVMDGLGFKKIMQENGRHMDGVDGFRIVYRA